MAAGGLVASLVWGAPGCGRFDGGAASADGGALDGAGPVERRELAIVPEWPTEAPLDPSLDPRVASFRLVLTDLADARRTLTQELATKPEGPVRVSFEASSRVEAKLLVVGNDGRVVGLGVARLDLAAPGPHPLPTRRRLLYVAEADRGPSVRVIDLADPDVAEGAFGRGTSLVAPEHFAGLLLTDDARRLVVANARAGGGGPASGELVVVDTASHAITRHPLDTVPGALAPLDATHVLVAPGDDAPDVALRVVDVGTGAAEPVPAGVQGGTLVVKDASRSPDGARVVLAGAYRATSRERPTLVVFDVAARTSRIVDVGGLLDGLGTARFVPGSRELVVVGWRGNGTDSVGQVLVFDERIGAPVRQLALPAPAAQPASVFVHPDGRHAFVTTDQIYAPGACCGGVRVVELAGPSQVFAHGMQANFPEWELDSALVLPDVGQGAHVLGGASDHGNNAHGPFADLDQPASGLIETARPQDDYGSLPFLATPFGSPL